MGGVDLTNRFCNDLRPSISGKKWYFCLWTNILCLLRVAAWRLHSNLQPGCRQTMDQLAFTRAIVQTMLNSHSNAPRPGPSGRASISAASVHVLEPSNRQGRCKVCKKNTTKFCKACNVQLHQRCYEQFHIKF